MLLTIKYQLILLKLNKTISNLLSDFTDWEGLCSYGKRQSPIDLQESTAKQERVEPLIFLHYDRPVQANLTNSGHTGQ